MIPQIHSPDEFQALAEELQRKEQCAYVAAYLRCEEVDLPDGGTRTAWDAVLYSKQEDRFFVVLDIENAPIPIPFVPPPKPPSRGFLVCTAAPLAGKEMVSQERLFPGLVDYPSLSHHIKRYLFARERLKPGEVLDCACGVGYGTNMLLHRDDVEHVVGVDISPNALKLAGKLVKSPRATFAPSLPDGQFDTVLSFETIEHVPNPHEFFEQLCDRLKPGGRMIISIPSEFWYGEYHFTHWNSNRFHRFVDAYFAHAEYFWQAFCGKEASSWGEIARESWGFGKDFSFLAVLEGPRRRRRPRMVMRRTGDFSDVLTLSAAAEQLRHAQPERDLVVVTDHPNAFCDNPHLDIVATTQWSGQVDVDLDHVSAADSALQLEAFQEHLSLPVTRLKPRLYFDPSEIVSSEKFSTDRPELLCVLHRLDASVWPDESWNEALQHIWPSFEVVFHPASGFRAPAIPNAVVYTGTLQFALGVACVARADAYLGVLGTEISSIADYYNKPSVLLAPPGVATPHRLGTAPQFIVRAENGRINVAAVLQAMVQVGLSPAAVQSYLSAAATPRPQSLPTPASSQSNVPRPTARPPNMLYQLPNPEVTTQEIDRLFPYTAVDKVNSIDARHRAFLYHLMMVGQFRRVLEVGTWIGYSSGAIVKALLDGAPSQVDFCDFRFQPQVRQLAAAAPPGRVRLIEQPSLQVIQPGYDFAFIDGDHSWVNLVQEIHLLLRAGIPNLLFHDTNTGALGEPQNAGPWIAKMILTQLPERWPRYYIDELQRPGERTERGLMLLTNLPREIVEPIWQCCMGSPQPPAAGDYGSSVVVGL